MKLWQLSVLLADEKQILSKYFSDIDSLENGKMDVDEEKLIKSLKESHLKYYITSNNYLRSLPDNPNIIKDEQYVSPISVLDAYNRFGADAITEVLDYGSWKIR